MPTQTYNAVNHELRSPGFVSGGLAATTTPKTVAFPKGTEWMSAEVHTLSTATVAQFNLNPWLTILKTTDSGATFTDYSEEAQNDELDSGVVLSSLDTVANGEALYVGSHLPFRGVQLDLDAKNDTAAVLTISYWNPTTKAWVDSSNTDGTDSSGDTLKVDGSNTWAVAAAWGPAALRDILTAANEDFNGTYVKPSTNSRTHVIPQYWTRWEVNTAIDSSVTAHGLHALGRSVKYAQIALANGHSQAFQRGFGGFGSFEYRTDAGTADIALIAGSGKGYFS